MTTISSSRVTESREAPNCSQCGNPLVGSAIGLLPNGAEIYLYFLGTPAENYICKQYCKRYELLKYQHKQCPSPPSLSENDLTDPSIAPVEPVLKKRDWAVIWQNNIKPILTQFILVLAIIFVFFAGFIALL